LEGETAAQAALPKIQALLEEFVKRGRTSRHSPVIFPNYPAR